jgi:hypothetical protein
MGKLSTQTLKRLFAGSGNFATPVIRSQNLSHPKGRTPDELRWRFSTFVFSELFRAATKRDVERIRSDTPQ